MRGKVYPSEPPALAGAEAPRGLKSAAHYVGIRMSAGSRQVVYDEMLPMEMAAAELDLDRLRRGFAELFDRAAQAVQLAGYEQDDAVFDRFLLVRTANGAEVMVRADWLADRERLIGNIAESLDCSALGAALSGVSITGIRVEAVVE